MKTKAVRLSLADQECFAQALLSPPKQAPALERAFACRGRLMVKAAEPQAILQAWLSFKEALGVTSVRTDDDYLQARATIDALLNEIGDDENHPLADVLDYLAGQVAVYEDEHCAIPEANPKEVLRFLMAQHGLKQEDLADCAPHSRISDILSGKCAVSKDVAKNLARRFNVSTDLFL